jgi:hypothetical protein
MSKRRGVSAQEKRDRVLTQLRESKRPWTTKELEKSAKKLGFHPMAMGDVLQGLLDDGLACKEKIGSSNYVWSFPSDAFKAASNKRRKITEAEGEREAAIARLTEERAELEPGRERTDEYLALQDELRTKRARLGIVETGIEANRANDPEVLKELGAVVKALKNHCDRSTDNLFAMKSYFVKKKNMDKKSVAAYLGMNDAFDYVE